MSHSPSLARTPAPAITLTRAGAIAGIVVAVGAAAVVSSVATRAWMNAGPAAAEPRSAVAPAPPVVPSAPGTGVPDAGEVFKGREVPAEEPVPTF